ncbi:flagellar FliJ family protein [Porticoccaceae bacterium]|jgi:flagellar export protein FliJ|nr:flagellar FliJ family protein [Porticoccaceae bacterium]
MKNSNTAVWDVLTSKAQAEARQARFRYDNALSRKEQAIARDQKVDQMLVEYAEKLNVIQGRAHSTTEAANFRQFLVQLQSIKADSSRELALYQHDCDAASKVLRLAEQERHKYEQLAERANQKQRALVARRETKEADVQSLMQFNLKSRSQY